jgi:hypothetical protein
MSDSKPKIVMVRYEQPEDSCNGCDGDIQTIEISRLDAGGGDYYRMATDGWAIDKPEDLLELFKAFQV